MLCSRRLTPCRLFTARLRTIRLLRAKSSGLRRMRRVHGHHASPTVVVEGHSRLPSAAHASSSGRAVGGGAASSRTRLAQSGSRPVMAQSTHSQPMASAPRMSTRRLTTGTQMRRGWRRPRRAHREPRRSAPSPWRRQRCESAGPSLPPHAAQSGPSRQRFRARKSPRRDERGGRERSGRGGIGGWSRDGSDGRQRSSGSELGKVREDGDDSRPQVLPRIGTALPARHGHRVNTHAMGERHLRRLRLQGLAGLLERKGERACRR